MMPALLLLAVQIIDPSDVRAAAKRLDAYCAILHCSRPISVSIHPDERMRGAGGTTRRLGHSSGCVIRLRREALYRPDWLAHEACHCAHDYDAMDMTGWIPSVPLVERTRREDEALRCAQKLMEAR